MMTGVALFMQVAYWHYEVVDSGRNHSTPVLFVDSRGYPVIVIGVNWPAGGWAEFRWTPAGWVESRVPDLELDRVRLDRQDFLHIFPPESPYAVDSHQTEFGWTAWENTQAMGFGFTVDSHNMPHFFGSYQHFYVSPDSTWAVDTPPEGFGGYPMMAVTDCRDNIHILGFGHDSVIYSSRIDSVWSVEIVHVLGDSGDLVLSGLWIYVDPFCQPHLFYNPYYYGDSDGYRVTYMWKDGQTWRREYYYTSDGRSLCVLAVDGYGVRHAVTGDSTGLYHVLRRPDDTEWIVMEPVAPIPKARKSFFVMDRFGYGHLVFTDSTKQILYYATSFLEYPPSEPEKGLILLMAPGGFWITGYSGEAKIYDPAGRLVLSKEIKGKTLISPLRPGVYFVVAGKERERVAVR